MQIVSNAPKFKFNVFTSWCRIHRKHKSATARIFDTLINYVKMQM
jgi:hypothetical protein